ncbi:MAG TPA: TlpA disulfide reductase family protein [Kofleriaceae bacterium]
MTEATVNEPGFLARIGMAILHPGQALGLVGDRRHQGRSSSDLFAMILLVVLATRLAPMVEATWHATAISISHGFRFGLHTLTRMLTFDLAFLVVAALVLWLAAGPRRNLSRAFDFACVVVLPLLLVELVATAVVTVLEIEVPRAIGWGLTGLAASWSAALIALAIRPIRRTAVSAPSPATVQRGRRAGLGVLALVVIGLATQAIWVVRNWELMRPVTEDMRAPAFALPTIGPGGHDGPMRQLADYSGKIIVLDFWATWCEPCLRSLPKLDALARGRDVAVLAINIDDDPVDARKLFDREHYVMELLVDHALTVKRRYNVVTIPHTVVIDPQGIVRFVARGKTAGVAAAVDDVRARHAK